MKYKTARCYICGKPISSVSSDVIIYCNEHRAYADLDDDIIRKAPKELLFTLIAGIFLRAREDYLYNADGQRTDAEVFLRGEWAQQLSMIGFDAEGVLDQLDKEIEDGLEGTPRTYVGNKR